MTKTILVLLNGKIIEYLHIDFTMEEWKNKTVSKIDGIVKEWCIKNGYRNEYIHDDIEWEIY